MKCERIDQMIEDIGHQNQHMIDRHGQHYLEVNLSPCLAALGVAAGDQRLASVQAIVPLKKPRKGMKVRIDRRTFIDYGQFGSGIVLPGYLARRTRLIYEPFRAGGSMVLDFS